MKASDVYLNFLDPRSPTGVTPVSVSDLIYVGVPIDQETGDDLDLVNEQLYNAGGEPI